MKTNTSLIARLLAISIIGLFADAGLRSQDCFSVNVAASKIILEPAPTIDFPPDGDTIAIPCTKEIVNFSIVIDFKDNSERYFEDSTQLVATLLHQGYTYILKYEKNGNTFVLPDNPTGLDTGTYSLSISASACTPYGVACGNCLPTYSFSVVFSGNVNLNVSIKADPDPPVLTCDPDSNATLTGTALPNNNFKAQWARLMNNQFINIPGATGNIYVTNQPGVYRYTLTGPSNCGASEIVTVAPPQLPFITISPDPQSLTACVQTIAGVAVGNAGNNPQFAWTAGNNGVIKSGENTLNPAVSAPGVYTLTVSRTDNLCTVSATVTMLPGDIPTVTVIIYNTPNSAQLDCINNSIKLTAVAGISGGSSGFTYQWSDGTSGPSIQAMAPGVYSVTATASAIGCQGLGTTAITENLAAPFFNLQTTRDTLCAGDQVTITAPTQAPSFFKWSDNTTKNTITVVPGIDGVNMYTVTVTDAVNGCTAVQSVPVVRLPVPVLTCSTPAVTLNNGATYTLNCEVSDGRLIWIANTVNLSDVSLSGAGPVQQTYRLTRANAPGVAQYELFGENPGCATDKVEVLVDVLPEAPDGIFIPDLVTPNGDGQNDTWNIVIPDAVTNPENYRLALYNRYGSEVYQGSLTTLFNAYDYPDGAYYYVLTKPDGGKITGALTILRRQAP